MSYLRRLENRGRILLHLTRHAFYVSYCTYLHDFSSVFLFPACVILECPLISVLHSFHAQTSMALRRGILVRTKLTPACPSHQYHPSVRIASARSADDLNRRERPGGYARDAGHCSTEITMPENTAAPTASHCTPTSTHLSNSADTDIPGTVTPNQAAVMLMKKTGDAKPGITHTLDSCGKPGDVSVLRWQ